MDFTLFSLFGAGFLTFFTPCVLPLIPVYLAALTGGFDLQGEFKGSFFLRGLFFSLGFVFVFALLGAGASTLGGFLQTYQNYLLLFGGILILIFGLKFLKIIEIPFLNRIVKINQSKLKLQSGLLTSFLFGVIFATGWSPCVGPILAAVLTYTLSVSADFKVGMLYLSVYGFGFALPFLLTALLADFGIKFTRKLNRFLPVFEKITGVVLLLAAFFVFKSVALPISVKTDLAVEKEIAILDQKPLLIEFYSKDCPICQKMEKIVNPIFEKCEGNHIFFQKIDLSQLENKQFETLFRVKGVPTFVLLDEDDTEVARLIGEQTEQTLYQAIATLRGETCEGVSLKPFSTTIPKESFLNLDSLEENDGKTCAGEN